jgi:hypothetical protein
MRFDGIVLIQALMAGLFWATIITMIHGYFGPTQGNQEKLGKRSQKVFFITAGIGCVGYYLLHAGPK